MLSQRHGCTNETHSLTIRYYLSLHTRPFSIVLIWARNIQACRLPGFSDCDSGPIGYGYHKFNLVQAIRC